MLSTAQSKIATANFQGRCGGGGGEVCMQPADASHQSYSEWPQELGLKQANIHFVSRAVISAK